MINKFKKNDMRTNNYKETVRHSVIMGRRSIRDIELARQEAMRVTEPKQVRLQTLYDNAMLDTLLTSQVELRLSKTLGVDFILRDKRGKEDVKSKEWLENSSIWNDFVKEIVLSKFYGYSLLELYNRLGELSYYRVRRQNIVPQTGKFYRDELSMEFINYREDKQYGITLLEFVTQTDTDFGLLNKVLPYVIYKRFVMGLWSEYCEIFGMPMRVYKTDTGDERSKERAKELLSATGSFLSTIIDNNDTLEFIQSSSSGSGDLYRLLIQECNNEISMLITGAIIGQDTEHGNRSKEESSTELSDMIVSGDHRYVELQMNKVVFPALSRLGYLPEGLTVAIQKPINITDLWTMTRESLPYYEVNVSWLKDTFGIDVVGSRMGDGAASAPSDEKNGVKMAFNGGGDGAVNGVHSTEYVEAREYGESYNGDGGDPFV
jgi:hypothetical protein